MKSQHKNCDSNTTQIQHLKNRTMLTNFILMKICIFMLSVHKKKKSRVNWNIVEIACLNCKSSQIKLLTIQRVNGFIYDYHPGIAPTICNGYAHSNKVQNGKENMPSHWVHPPSLHFDFDLSMFHECHRQSLVSLLVCFGTF